MSHSHKILVGLLTAMALLVLFQNCGDSKTVRDNPLNDRVSKLDSTLDKTDDDLILSDISIQAVALEDSSLSVNDTVKECRNLLGSQKADCISRLLRLYYAYLESHKGFTLLSGPSCILAFRQGAAAEHEMIFDSTCAHDASKGGRAQLDLGACLLFANPKTGYITNFASLPFNKSRYFQRLRAPVKYDQAGEKNISLSKQDINGQAVNDACGRSQTLSSLGVQTSITAP